MSGKHLPADTFIEKSSTVTKCLSLILDISQIEKDLLRTMPSNACFSNMNSIGVPRLRRILRGLAWLYPEIGYCQGTGMVKYSFSL